MNKLIGLAFVSSVLLFSGCNWCCWKCSDKASCCGASAAICPCGMKDCHCPEGKCTCVSKTEAGTGVIAISSDKEFEEKVLGAQKPAVVKFGAPWCGACQEMKPVFEEVAKAMGDKYLFAEVNVDQAEAVAKQYDIKGIPAFIFFENGKEAKDSNRIIGTTGKEDLTKAIHDNLGD